MKQKLLKTFFLFLISAGSLITITVLACAGGDWDGTEGSLFSPYIINQPQYEPFFRTVAYPFYGEEGYDDAGAASFRKSNNAEWQNFFEKKLSAEAIDYWLYEASLNQIDSMIFSLKDKPANLTEKSLQYSLKKGVSTAKATAFLYYVGFAKRNESFAVKEIDYSWDPQPKKPSAVSISKQITGGLNFFGKTTVPFLKERYAFQLIRAYYFNGEYDKAIAFYDENEKLFTPDTYMKWRSLGYKAAALYKKKNYALSNKIYAKLYTEFKPLQRSAYLSFHPMQGDEWNKCLTLAENVTEKEQLWQLQGLYTNPVIAMQQILALNPKSTLVDLLLVRAVNIEEEKVNGILVSKPEEQKEMENAVSGDLQAFLNLVSASGQPANPSVWHLSAAYINYIKADYATADQQLKRAEKYLRESELMKAQYHLISFFGKIRRLKEINVQEERKLLTDAAVVFDNETKPVSNFRGGDARRWVRHILADLYAKKGDFEKAEIIKPGTVKNRYATTENIKAMIAYYDNPDKSDFEKLFLRHAELSKTDYQELLAIRYAQRDELDNALAIFKAIPNFSVTLLGNPFTIHIKDCHDCDHEAPQKTKYTKTSFIAKMIEMKTIAASKPEEAAQNYFLVANGFYNMTYFGNARVFYVNAVDEAVYDYEAVQLPEENNDLALKYYLMARDKSTDKEFKAKCTFMAAKCEQNHFFMNRPKYYEGDFKSGQYFAELRKFYAGTNYYSEIIKECGYFKTYVRK